MDPSTGECSPDNTLRHSRCLTLRHRRKYCLVDQKYWYRRRCQCRMDRAWTGTIYLILYPPQIGGSGRGRIGSVHSRWQDSSTDSSNRCGRYSCRGQLGRLRSSRKDREGRRAWPGSNRGRYGIVVDGGNVPRDDTEGAPCPCHFSSGGGYESSHCTCFWICNLCYPPLKYRKVV